MYECPNCGGNLKFDIPSQLLKCAYCETTRDPYTVSKDQDAEENSVFDVTVFTCPQCGGEIMSTDTSAAEFCSFCGASTILQSRVSMENRPAHIIPFKQTKDACKKAYMARMKRAPFAPDELKDEKHIDGFRGIYMPYWSYDISQEGPVLLKGEKSYIRGDYSYTDYYDLSGQLDASYNHLSFDASSSFADNISEQIAPFDVRDKKDFTPSFLSGFYADTSDVDSDLYKNDAIDIANSTSYDNLRKVRAFADLKLSMDKNNFSMTNTFHTYCNPPYRVMYPVWFMSYRKNDRVAYATVNGQTGKVAADLPVDLKKYMMGSVLLALPIFLLLNLFFTIRPKTVLMFAAFLSIYTLDGGNHQNLSSGQTAGRPGLSLPPAAVRGRPKGREKKGYFYPSERSALLQRLRQKLPHQRRSHRPYRGGSGAPDLPLKSHIGSVVLRRNHPFLWRHFIYGDRNHQKI